MNVCVKCKFVKNPSADVETAAVCNHPRNVSNVTGGVRDILCLVMRDKDGPCGPEGSLYAERSVPDERTGTAMR